MKNRFVFSLITTLVALTLVSCKQEGGAGGGDVIKIGEFASLPGKAATFGISSHEGTIIASEELNAAGGLLGENLVLQTEHTKPNPGNPATVVNKLIAR